jgi:1-acyl-sn-glycerol-3-phosphate acyltransferase
MRKKYEAQAHTGAARIALEAGVPLVPAGIKGTNGLAKLEQLKVVYGEPIPLDDLQGLDEAEAARIATDRLMEAIHSLEASL